MTEDTQQAPIPAPAQRTEPPGARVLALRRHLWSPPQPVPPKAAYAVEHVLLQDWPDRNFRDDRAAQVRDFVGFHIYGTCPSCGHETSALCSAKYLAQDDVVYQDDRPTDPYEQEWRQPAGRVTNVTLLRCACLSRHEGGPDGSFGCGSEWLLRVTYSVEDPAAPVHVYPVREDEACRYWHPAEDVTDSVPKALADAQAGAGKWQGSLSALLAVLGLSAVLAGRDTILSLGTGAKWALGVAALVAILGNLLMLYFSDLASFGFPKIAHATQPRSLLDSDLAPLVAAQRSTSNLRVARAFTAVALAGALVATGVFLFAPKQVAQPGSKLTVTVAGSGDTGTKLTTACGVARFDDDARPTTVTFTPPEKGARPVTYPIGEVSAIEPC